MGASHTKQTSVLQQVNEIVNDTVNKSSTSIIATASASQNISMKCSKEQLELAIIANDNALDAYALAYKYYANAGSKGKPPVPPIQLCTASNILQKATVVLKSDNDSKKALASSITTELQSKAEQYDSLAKTTPMVGYTDTDKTSINQIITNVKNSKLFETVLEIVNTAIVDQNIGGDGAGYSNISQESTVSMIAGNIIGEITKDINKADLELETDQKTLYDEKSGQVEGLKAVTEMIGNIFKGIMGSWMLILVCIIGAVVMFPGVFCIIPPLRIPLGLMGLCSKKNNPQYQPMPSYQPMPQYQQPPQQYQQPPQQYQQPPQQSNIPSAPYGYSDIIVQKNNL